jgi:hypothetical protein
MTVKIKIRKKKMNMQMILKILIQSLILIKKMSLTILEMKILR